jgi:group I intron endonuclease
VYGVVYKITNKVNGKFYIGQTITSFGSRWSKHKQDARNGAGWVMAAAIRKYGSDSFTHTVLEVCVDRASLNAAEMRWVDELKPAYNSCAGGGGLGSPTAAVRAKISAASMGRKHTAAAKARMSEAQKGHFVSSATAAKIQAALAPRYAAMRQARIEKNGTDKRIRTQRKYVSPLAAVYAAAGVLSRNEKISFAAKLGYESGSRIRQTGALNPMYGQTKSVELKQKLSESSTGENNPFYGKSHTEDTRSKMRAAHAARTPVECPHCGKKGHLNTMKRWHFDNCRGKQ